VVDVEVGEEGENGKVTHT
jgi:hypothetical protein